MRKQVLVLVTIPFVFALAVYLVANGSGNTGKTKRAKEAIPAKVQVPSDWGEYIDGSNKFAIRFPPGWSVGVEDRQWLKGEEAISFASPTNLPSFNVSIYPNPQGLSAKQWFDKKVKEAGRTWGGREDIIAGHPVTINGQTGYAALMDMPDSHIKFTYLTWRGRVYMIYYPRWWTSMTAYQRRYYKSHYATQELMLQTFRPVE